MKRKNCLSLVLLFVIASMLVSSCQKNHEDPQLILSTDTIVFKGHETRSLYITTNNTERREVYANCPDSWFQVSPYSGRIVEGDTLELKLTSYNNDFTTITESYLYLSSAYDQKRVKLIGLPEDYIDYAFPDTLFFQQNNDNVIMRIHNRGNVTLNYSITASTSFVSFTPTSGEVPMLQHADIDVTIDRENLLTLERPELYVTINETVDTVLLVPEKKMMLPNDVVDAEYAKATDLMVYAAADASLNIYHPDTKTLSTIPLSYAPTCVSISPDGTRAVVGHDAHVTYVDLMNESVLTTNDISCDALDIVLTDNGWTYVFPRRDQWTRIVCLDVSTNNAIQTAHTGNSIYAGTKAKLHPSGKFVYGADNGISPSDIEKYDIQNGTASYLYDSPYHGDYGMGGNLWFEENGDRLFTRAATVFKTSETQSMDMIYNGKITFEDDYRSILWLDHLDQKSELYLVITGNWYYDDPNVPYVYVYNSDNLTYKTKMRIEDFSVATDNSYAVYPASPYYVFANSNGAELYVITKAIGSGMLHEWAIETMDIE